MIQIWYHANCPDGFTAAWIARKIFPKGRFVALNYIDPVPEHSIDDNILILDFSFPLEVLEQLKKEVKRLEILDHHKTAPVDFIKANGVFNLDKSGAMLTWEWFHPHQPPLNFIRYVEDRDLWRWILPHSRLINDYFGSFEFTFENWNYLSCLEVSEWIAGGKEINRYKNVLIKRILENNYLSDKLSGVLSVNSPIFQSELGNELAKISPSKIGEVWFRNKNDQTVHSLRSIGDDIDVAEIAKTLGGGGHKNAAGYTTKEK